MVRLPQAPAVADQAPQSPPVQAPNAVPMQDATGQQVERLGQATLRAGLSAMDVGDAIQDEIDEGRTKQAELALVDLNDEAETGYKALLGGKAVDGYKDALAAFDRNSEQAIRLLQNDTQRMLFGRLQAQHKVRYQAALRGHYADQARNFAIGQTTARAQKWAQKWSADRGDATARAQMLAEVDNLSEYAGEDADQRAQRRLRWTTEATALHVQQRLDAEDTEGARAVLEQAGDEVDPETRGKLGRDIRGEVTKQRGMRAGTDAVAAVAKPRTNDDGVPLALDPDQVQRDALAALDRRVLSDETFAADVTAQNRAQAQVKAWADAMRQQNASEASRALQGFQAWYRNRAPGSLPPAASDFPGRELLVKHGLEGAVERFTQGTAFGWKTDRERMWDWRTTDMQGWTPERFAATWRPALDDWMLTRAQAKWQKDNGAQDPKGLKLLTDEDHVRQWYRKQLGLEDGEKLSAAQSDHLQRVMQRLDDLGASLNETDIKKVLEVATQDVSEAGGIEKSTYAQTPAEQGEAFVTLGDGTRVADADISRDMQVHLTRAIEAAGGIRPGETPTRLQLAQAFAESGYRRPIFGDPGETAAVGLAIVGRDTAREWAADILSLQSEIPGSVLGAVESEIRRVQKPGGLTSNAVTPDAIRARWEALGRPKTVDAYEAAARVTRQQYSTPATHIMGSILGGLPGGGSQ